MFPVIILFIILGFLAYKYYNYGNSVESNFIFRFLNNFINNIPSLFKYFYMLVFWILPLDTVFVKLKNRILGGNSTSWFKSDREQWGMWSPWKNQQFGLIGLGILISFSLLYFSFTTPGFIKFFKWPTIITFTIIFCAFFALLLRNDYSLNMNNPFPAQGTNNDKTSWLFDRTSNYLKYLIGTGLILAILFIILYFFGKNVLFTTGGTFILMSLIFVGFLGVLYWKLSKNDKIQKLIKKYSFVGKLYYLLFLIPCLFQDTVKFIYDNVRHTPNTVYIVFILELLLISFYLILPIIQKYFYTMMPGNKDKSDLIKIDIRNKETEIIILENQIKDIKKYKSLTNADWDNIIERGLNESDKEEDLKSYLIDYLGFMEEKGEAGMDVKEAIKYVQESVSKIRGLEMKIDRNKNDIKELKEMQKFDYSDKSVVLLRDPIYLKTQSTLFNNYNENRPDDYLKYNYNYAISCWVFLHSNRKRNEYVPILNYANRPTILYNSYNNKLKIVMNNGKFMDNKCKNTEIDLNTFYNDISYDKDVLSDYFKDNDMINKKKSNCFRKKTITYKNFPLQKWTNIVINFDDGVLDVFVNSKLIATVDSIVPYMERDNVIVGSVNGISGGICNVVYFPNSISKERIDLNYNLLKNKNPPII